MRPRPRRQTERLARKIYGEVTVELFLRHTNIIPNAITKNQTITGREKRKTLCSATPIANAMSKI
jgi:hypothetical protein